MATQEKYQGWANWETWNVALWFGNDQGLYHAVREHPTKFTAASAKAFTKEMLPNGTPDFKGGRSYSKVDWKEIAADFNEMRGDGVSETRGAWHPRVRAVEEGSGMTTRRMRQGDDEDKRDERWVTIYDDEAIELMPSWTGGQSDPLYAISSSGGANYAWVIQDAVVNLDSDIAKVKKLGNGKFQLGKGTFTKAEINGLHIIHDALVMALEDPESYSTEGPRTRETVRALPAGQRTYTIKISGGRNAGEYEGESTLAATVKKAKTEFLPHLGPHETLKVVHFDRDGERTHVDVVIHSPPLGGPPPMHEHVEFKMGEVAAAGRSRGAPQRGSMMTAGGVLMLAGELSRKVGGTTPKYIDGGHRWSDRNESAQFTTYSPEQDQKVVVLVSIFEDGNVALDFFSDEYLSETNRYENVAHFLYGSGTGATTGKGTRIGANDNVESMVKDIEWVWKTVDSYAESWRAGQDDEMDEARRSVAASSSKAPIRRWMLANVDRFIDRRTGEIDCTSMVEAWDNETQNGGVTTDPDHIAWDVAVEVADEVRRKMGVSEARRGSELPEELKSVIGTLAHNRQFTPAELEQYTRFDRPHIASHAVLLINKMVKMGYLKRESRGHYFPTKEGWAWIEGGLNEARRPHAPAPHVSGAVAAIGSDGLRLVVWGLGETVEAARIDAIEHLDDCAWAAEREPAEYADDMIVRYEGVNDEQRARIVAGEIDCADLGIA